MNATLEIRTASCAPMILSNVLATERILLFFGRESSREIIECLSQTFQDLDWEHVLNAVRVYPAGQISPTVQLLHGRMPGLRETKAALAVSRLGIDDLPESHARIHVILMLLSPDRFSERVILRKMSKLFRHQDLENRISKLVSELAVMEAVRVAEFN
jgi:hypothetical protein